MLTVFKPIHDEMFSTITKNSDLLIEDDLPEPLKVFCAQVAAYRVVFERCSKSDFAEHTAALRYPIAEMTIYLGSSLKRLKSEQGRLLGSRLPTRRIHWRFYMGAYWTCILTAS
jgi:hypothetical protein